MSGSNDEARAVRVMVETLRAEPPPELDWSAIEHKLLAEVARRDRVVARPPPSALRRVFAYAAVAACVAFGASSVGGSGELRGAAIPVGGRVIDTASTDFAPGEHDMLSLRAGDVIETGNAAATFRRGGVVSWTLAPGSRAVIRSLGTAGNGSTVTLERGSIRAEVTPRDPSEGLVEAFAVEADHTRVAVHGTAFSVTRTGASLDVDVEHGSVAVGPTGNAGVTMGHLLVGPSRASFSLDGGREARFLPRRADAIASSVAVEPLAGPNVAHAAEPSSTDPVEPAILAQAAADLGARTAVPGALGPRPLPAGGALEKHAAAEPPVPLPADAAPLLTSGIVGARLMQCFESTYRAPTGVSVVIESTLRLTLDAAGNVKAKSFDPPIAPALQACANGAAAGRFAEGVREVAIPVNFAPRGR